MSADGPDDDVELGRKERGETRVASQGTMQGQGGHAAGRQILREGSAGHQRQQALGGPQRDGHGTWTGAFQGNFAQMRVVRAQVGVGRVVAVVVPDGGVAEQHAAAAVGLEPVLVGVDGKGIGLRNAVERLPGFGVRLSASVK